MDLIYKTILAFVDEVMDNNNTSNHWFERAQLVRSFVNSKVDDPTLEHLKQNIINTARDHQKTCSSPNCGVSTTLLMVLAEQAGIKFTPEERALFL